ncbi:hypothetical protein YC2023_085755 [Brassica napus]
MKRDGEFVEEDKVVIAHKEVHDHVFGGCARKREEDGKEAKENVENGNQGFGCAREDKETQTSSVSKSCRKITLVIKMKSGTMKVNPKFHILKTLLHPSTLNSKSRLTIIGRVTGPIRSSVLEHDYLVLCCVSKKVGGSGFRKKPYAKRAE